MNNPILAEPAVSLVGLILILGMLIFFGVIAILGIVFLVRFVQRKNSAAPSHSQPAPPPPPAPVPSQPAPVAATVELKRCPQCHLPLAADAPEGLCPHCLVRA